MNLIQNNKIQNNKISTILKIIGFAILGAAGYIDLMNSSNSILEDPFSIGAFTMSIASFLTLLNPSIYYIHTGMFFFIFTKIISQITNSKKYDIWGKKTRM